MKREGERCATSSTTINASEFYQHKIQPPVVVHAVTFTLEVEVVGGSWSKEAYAGRGSGCMCDKRTGVAI